MIVDVEASRAIRQGRSGRPVPWSRARRIALGYGRRGLRLTAPTASAEHLAWLVHERGIEPRIPVFDKSEGSDGTFSRSAFTYDPGADVYTRPAGKPLRQRQKVYRTPPPLVDADAMMRDHASKRDCDACALKPRCCPNPSARKMPGSIHEAARQLARDVIVQPAALITECPMVGSVLATHLSLPPGSTHKTFCERRRSGI